MSINHEKYTLVIIDEYSRYTWVYFLRKKSQAPEMIMSFIRMVENQNDVKVKQIRTDNGTEFRNHELESFCDERGISQNFSSPYTPEQNGVAERKNRTLIEAARTMLNGSVLSKHFWTEVVRIACYTQNRSIIVKRHDKTPYEIFRERISDICHSGNPWQSDWLKIRVLDLTDEKDKDYEAVMIRGSRLKNGTLLLGLESSLALYKKRLGSH
ncbi:retrovirus-related pol polyprotein from transposon TNT 1-94 [Tanacetum coccineum]